MAKKKLRVGIIGCGGISGIHFSGWQKYADAEIVACTDIHLPAAEKRAEEFSVADVEKNTAALLKRKDIDVVDICTANRSHKPITIQALRAGKHVICEKPLALTGKEVDQMIAAAKTAKKKVMCAQHERFSANALAMKEYIDGNPLGDIYYGRAWYNRRRQLPARDTFIYNELSGGGPCIDVGVHTLDLALHLMGNFEPVSVTGIAVNKIAPQPESFTEFEWGNFDKKGMDVEDFAAGLIRFKNGAALSLECSFMLNQKASAEMKIDLFGDKAGIAYPALEAYDCTANHYRDTKITARNIKPEAHEYCVHCFADALLGKRKDVPVLPAQSRAVMAILDGLYKSAKIGKEVKL